jgi:hypothetical protein
MENPRGDSFVLGSVAAGTVLQISDRRGDWYQVQRVAPGEGAWRRGWIQARFLEVGAAAPAASARREARMIRGFAQASGELFHARDSFETVLGSRFGSTLGAGGQIGLAKGVYAEVTVDRFRKTGSRAIVSGTQAFRLQTPAVITATPVQFTVGYRERRSYRVVPYLGAGLGWHSLEEESPSLAGSEPIRERHLGYHVLGGAEYPIGSWLSVAGELQWATVPGVLGSSGVSAIFDEDDFGGTAFRVKVLVGR